MIKALLFENWQEVKTTVNTENKFNVFYTILIDLFNIACALKLDKHPVTKVKSWVNTKIRESSENLKGLYFLQKMITKKKGKMQKNTG